MTKEEFLKLDDAGKLSFLNSEAATKDFAQISAEIGMTKAELGKIGFYYVGNKFLLKPMKGYGTTERSGNEYKDRFK
ncbi:MAG: hypothetical protein GX207_06450 [Peptococcaceae bacterium]|nr:hypothetical protein [Peptococcaceae bacterium]